MQFRPPMQAFSRPPFLGPGLAMPPGVPPPSYLMRPPMMMQPPPAGPVVLTPPGTVLLPAPATKSTTLYVGKIAASVPDDVIKTLLESCGHVKSWKPMQDPETNKSKGFGFCEYETAEGVLRALRLLHNLSLDGQELLLKCNTATQRYIDDYQANKKREAERKKADTKQSSDTDKDATADETEAASEDKQDDSILAKIMGIVSDRAAQQRGSAADQANDFLNDILPPPPTRERQSSGKEQPSSGKDRSHGKERERGSSGERAAERQLERERAREKREIELRKAGEERAYDKTLREWEHIERLREKAMDKEKSDKKGLDKERAKLIRNDNEFGDDDEDDEPWQRKLIHTSRHAESRRRKRKEEQKQDAADADAEEVERATARQKHEEEAQLRAEDEAAQSSQDGASEQMNSDLDMADARVEDIDPDDPIYQAMMAAAQAPPRVASPQHQSAASSPDATAQPRSTASKQSAPANRGGWSTVFGSAEQETPQRRLIPLNYSEEEQQAAQAAAAAAAAAATATPASPASGINKDEEVEKLKKQIPRSMHALSSSNINWEAYDAAQPKIGVKVGKWVSGQIEKLLGQQEDTLLNFVQGELNKHSSPSAMLNELSPILDLEGEEFVLKLYQIVIFESSKFAILGHL